MDKEADRLARIADSVSYSKGFNAKLAYYRFITIKEFFKGETCLELGCADGVMTEYLIQYFQKIVAVDGSNEYCRQVEKKLPGKNIEIICSLFEELELERVFDTIVMAHILEHVEFPARILEKAKTWLFGDEVMIIDVPNANSLHRLAGVKMGVLEKPDAFSEADIKLGHRRVYTWEGLRKEIKKAGLRIIHDGGVFLKPLSNDQIEAWFTQEMNDAFYELGREFPEIAAEIYVICSL